METQEIWKDIIGYEGLYQVSNTGRIKSLERRVRAQKEGSTQLIKEKIRKISYNSNGYALVVLAKEGKNKTFLVHKLVANAFVDNPNEYTIVNHKDECKSNNNSSNLEWCTSLYNNTYRNIHLRRNTNNVVRKIIQYDLDMNEIKRWDSLIEACNFYNIQSSNVIKCCKGERSTACGFVWRYRGESFDKYPIRIAGTNILQYDLNDNFIEEHNSIIEASKKLNISVSSISNCCMGISQTAGGFKWKYKILD